ncbi:hypothetical protein NUW58_g1546 [Xylaria curta]|uniref:Uncharacterized protein n=1 Tax=Xylaria curta TaxID=42375 RepID=A0ACC1PJV0_9PEZI|nr:hypothetical protein NUW58_g1546 [Xylaria curta]
MEDRRSNPNSPPDPGRSQQVMICFDGGGIRGYASLKILECLMQCINAEEIKQRQQPSQAGESIKDENNVYPAHYFDYFYGTSTGGLISVMLGRWRMSVSDALRAYEEICDYVFAPEAKNRFGILPLVPKWNESRLVERMQEKVRNFTPDGAGSVAPSVFTQLSSPEGLCRVGVVSYTKWGLNRLSTLGLSDGTPDILRTFKCKLDSGAPNNAKFQPRREIVPPSKVSIIEACRATTAAPIYFRSQSIGDNRFIDGGVGTNNPTRRAWKEVESQIRRGGRRMGYECPIIVSIGTGMRTGRWLTDTESAHLKMTKDRDIPPDHYFRFNVKDQGLYQIKMDSEKARDNGLLDKMVDLVHNEFGSGSENLNRMTQLAEKIVKNRRERSDAEGEEARSRWTRFTDCTWYECQAKGCERGIQVFYNHKDFDGLYYHHRAWQMHCEDRHRHNDGREEDEQPTPFRILEPHYNKDGVKGPW